MSNLTKNVSPEDKKMLNSIFLRWRFRQGWRRRLAVLRPARA